MFPELSAWGYAGGLADDLRPRIARIGTDIRTSKGEMRGSLHCGGKSAAFGRDDETFVLDSLGLVEMARFCAGFAGRVEMTRFCAGCVGPVEVTRLSDWPRICECATSFLWG